MKFCYPWCPSIVAGHATPETRTKILVSWSSGILVGLDCEAKCLLEGWVGLHLHNGVRSGSLRPLHLKVRSLHLEIGLLHLEVLPLQWHRWSEGMGCSEECQWKGIFCLPSFSISLSLFSMMMASRVEHSSSRKRERGEGCSGVGELGWWGTFIVVWRGQQGWS
jgi:hypothetical protein